MNQLLFAVGCLIFFLTTGGIVLVGGHLLQNLAEDNPRPSLRDTEPELL